MLDAELNRMRTGFIGLGKMGQRMARRLAASGQKLTVFDSDPTAIAGLVACGAEAATSAGALAQHADVVMLSLPTPEIVESVARGLAGGEVRLVADLSTTGPEAAKRIGASLDKAGIKYVDAPVSGGTSGAEAGTLSIMVSGDQAAVAELEPLLRLLGKIFYLGREPGQAQAMKVINNTLCAAANISAFEGLVLGAKLGLDPRMMLTVINASSGRSFATEVKIPQCILERSFPMRFTTTLLAKDVQLCLSEGERLGVPMPVSDETRKFLQRGVAAGLGDLDYGHLITLVEKAAGAQFGTAAEERE
jgi:3-hydroxyisobutyrate dehydrogenase